MNDIVSLQKFASSTRYSVSEFVEEPSYFDEQNASIITTLDYEDNDNDDEQLNGWFKFMDLWGVNIWAVLATLLVICTAGGNILVCLAIYLERRLQNVTNYFLMSLAITDCMVALLVMPLGIMSLVNGHFQLPAVYCLLWICLDVLLCTASIMHLCTISVDRYLSLRYPMKFGRNKTRKRVTVKIAFVWIASTAMSVPLSLMYSQDVESLLVDGVCQIPDPLYKSIGSIVSFYIPLVVMLVTYTLTVQLLARQRKGLGGGWASGWLGVPAIERRCTWRRLLGNRGGTAQHSAASTETELPPVDTRDLWLQDSRFTINARIYKGASTTVVDNLLPLKLREKYNKAYENFMKWKSSKDVNRISESVLLVYFEELSKHMQPPTLWSIYSMLKATINTKVNIDIKMYTKLTTLLKRFSDGHQPKKTKVLSCNNIETFLNEAPDYSYLLMKVVLIFGLNGACRGKELLTLTVDNVQKHSELVILVVLPDIKTKRERSFIIKGEHKKFVEKYQTLRPSDYNNNRFFIQYRNGRCVRQIIGNNKLSSIPGDIARFFKLESPELYTGHCFRRTSASILADSGADITLLKRHGGWKSSSVAEGYIEESIENKSKISNQLTNNIKLRPISPLPGSSYVTKSRPVSPLPGCSNDIKQRPISPLPGCSSDKNQDQLHLYQQGYCVIHSQSQSFSF